MEKKSIVYRVGFQRSHVRYYESYCIDVYAKNAAAAKDVIRELRLPYHPFHLVARKTNFQEPVFAKTQQIYNADYCKFCDRCNPAEVEVRKLGC